MTPSLELYQMDFATLSALVYRDAIKQKHDGRQRLQEELTAGKQEEENAKSVARKAFTDESDIDDVAELFLEHLLKVA